MHRARRAERREGAAAGVRAGELAARAAGAASRLTGRGGTSLPGKLLLRLEPGAIARLAAPLVQARGDTGLFEVDEFWLPQVLPQVRPRALLLANLFRDQLDRYGELETIAERWAAALTATPVEQL